MKQTVVVLAHDFTRYTELLKTVGIPNTDFVLISPPKGDQLLSRVEQIEQKMRKLENTVSLVIGMSDRLSLIAALLNQRLKLPGVDPLAIARTQHKGLFLQLAQTHAVPIPPFILLEQRNTIPKLPFSFPIFIKPARGAVSAQAKKIDTIEKLAQHNKTLFSNPYDDDIKSLLATAHTTIPAIDSYIAQPFITDDQYTADIAVVAGKARVLAVTKSIYNQNRTSFYEFSTPISYDSFASQLQSTAQSIVDFTGLDRLCCNIEFFLTKQNELCVIECNTRPSVQFITIISHAYQTNYLQTILAVALGKDLRWPKQQNTREARIRVFRRETDALVREVPSTDELQRLQKKYSLLEIVLFAKPGVRLSEQSQDAYTFRLGYISFAGTEAELDTIWPMLESEVSEQLKVR